MIKITSLVTTLGTFATVYLINDEPDWSFPVEASFNLVTQVERSLTGREARRPHSKTLRCRLQCGATLRGSTARAASFFLRGWTNEPVAMPCWPLAVRWADRASRPVTSGLYIVWKADWSNYAIYETVEPGWPASDDLVAPCLWGRLNKREGKWLNSEVFGWAIDFIEASESTWAMVPATASFANGPTPTGFSAAPKLLPFQIDFSTLDAEVAVDFISRRQIGFRRKPSETVYGGQKSRATTIGHFAITQGGVGQALRWFYEHGFGKAFWAPSYQSAAVLTSQLASSAVNVQVSDTSDLKEGDRLAFVSPGGTRATEFDTVILVTSSTGFDIDNGLVAAQPVDDTMIYHLLLARHSAPDFSIKWHSRETAEAAFEVFEIPAEGTIAADETLGTTLGELKQRAYLYEFSQGGSVIERWTSFDASLQDAVPTEFLSVSIDHGDIRQGLHLDQDNVDITTDGLKNDGTKMALHKLANNQSEQPLFVGIREEQIDPITGEVPSSPTYIFTGEVEKVDIDGGILTARCVSGGTMFDRKIPRFRLQIDCNYTLFSPPCTLLKTDWKFQCTVNGAPGATYPFTINLQNLTRVTGTTPTYFANWFAGGFIEFGTQRRAILTSTNPSGGALSITVDRAFDATLINGSTVFLYPGCDGRFVTCKAYHATNNPEGKFGNDLNYGGHPFLPASNPSVVKVSQGAGGGKK